MQVLSTICDTFVPSLPPPAQIADSKHGGASPEEISAFYSESASNCGVPEQVAGMMTQFLRPAILSPIRLILSLLSTRFGSLLLGGRSSLTRQFPYVQSFLCLPLHKREEILYGWATGSSIFQGFFKVFKGYILRAFYTKVNENGRNPVWKAIDYCGPDPRCKSTTNDVEDRDRELESKVVKMNQLPREKVVERLMQLGVSIVERTGSRDVIQIETDAVIIGSGAGGSVVAAKLAEAGHKVVIMEKGEYVSRKEMSLLEGKSAESMYEGAAFVATEDGLVAIMAGSTVGGGTTINWSASLRTPEHVLTEWADQNKLDLFKSSSYKEAMDTVCLRLGVQEAVFGENFPNSVLRQGCRNLNVHVSNVPRNAAADHMCGWCGFGCKAGLKQSVNLTWLLDALAHGAVVLSRCEAKRVLLSKHGSTYAKSRRARGVVAATADGGEVVVHAKVVVVACGALWTPLLLRRSGLLNAHIGRNLHLHPVMFVWGYFPPSLPPAGKCYEGGIMTAFTRAAANWETTGSGALLMVPSLHPGAFAAFIPWTSGSDAKDRMCKFARTAHIIALTRDTGSGSVSEDKDGHLCIQYTLSGIDKESCLTAAELGLRILMAAGATEVGTQNVNGQNFRCCTSTSAEFSFSSSCNPPGFDDFLSNVRSVSLRRLNTPLASAHQMGSCRMGTHPSTSALDPRCETWEAQGLFVADSSVFPSASGVNPMITVQSIALCTSHSVLEYLEKMET